MRGHDEVIVDREVEALVAGPADVESLALDRARGHVDELLQHAQLRGVVQVAVAQDGSRDQREGEVAHVDRKPFALGEVQARLAAAQRRLVGDVVVDEGSRVEVLDSSSRGLRLFGVSANSLAGEHADERPMPLAAVLGELGERTVQVALHVGMRPVLEERGDVVVYAFCLRAQEVLKNLVSHSAYHTPV